MAVFGRAVGRRDVFSRRRGASPRRQMRRRFISIGVGTFLRLHRSLDARPPHRAHARAAQLGDGGLHPRRLLSARALSSSPVQPGPLRASGLVGFDLPRGTFSSCRRNADFLLLAALAGYSGAGGMVNIALSSWARDKGYGMGQRAGYIPAAVGGHKVNLAHTGFIFTPDAENMRRWHGWWRIVRADQWGVFFVGAMLGMVLPAVLYVTLLPSGSEHPGTRHRRSARVGRGHAIWSDRWASSSRCWRHGFSSRRNSTSSKAWCARSPTSSGPAAIALARGAAATCASSTTARWRWSASGELSRCAWRSPSCSSCCGQHRRPGVYDRLAPSAVSEYATAASGTSPAAVAPCGARRDVGVLRFLHDAVSPRADVRSKM